MNFIINFILAFPAAGLILISIALIVYAISKSKVVRGHSLMFALGSLLMSIVLTLNSPLVKPKTNVEPFKPSEVVTHQLDEETASKPFTDRLSKPKESKLNDSLTFKQEVQKYNN